MSVVKVCASLLTGLTLSFSAAGTDLINFEEFPEWFTASKARDHKVTETSTLNVDAFNINAEVKGKYELAEQADNYWYYVIEAGLESPVECYIFTDFDGPSNSLKSIVEHSMTGVAELNKKEISSTYNAAIKMGVIDDTPYLSLQTLYDLSDGKERVLGILQSMSAQTDNSLQICLYNGLGYESAFYSVFESFIQAFTASESDPTFFQSVYGLSFNNIPIGFSRERYVLDADGDVEITNQSSIMIPVDDSSLSLSDSLSRSWSYTDGSLINATAYTIENGEVASNFSISYSSENWNVKGELQGKPLESTLEYDGVITSDFGTYLNVAKLHDSPKQKANFRMWVSDADPTSAMPVTLSKIEDNDAANFNLVMGPIEMNFDANKNGVFQTGSMQQGPLDIKMNLLYSKGEPVIK